MNELDQRNNKAAREPTPLEVMTKRIHGCNERALMFNSGIDELANRLLGPIPECEPQCESDRPEPFGEYGKLNDAIGSLEDAIDNLGRRIERLYGA